MASRKLFENNDTVIELDGVKNGVTGKPITDAVVTFNVLKNDVLETTGTWPASMTFVSGSRGTYRGVVENTLDLVDGDCATVVITVDSAGLTAQFSRDYRVGKRN